MTTNLSRSHADAPSPACRTPESPTSLAAENPGRPSPRRLPRMSSLRFAATRACRGGVYARRVQQLWLRRLTAAWARTHRVWWTRRPTSDGHHPPRAGVLLRHTHRPRGPAQRGRRGSAPRRAPQSCALRAGVDEPCRPPVPVPSVRSRSTRSRADDPHTRAAGCRPQSRDRRRPAPARSAGDGPSTTRQDGTSRGRTRPRRAPASDSRSARRGRARAAARHGGDRRSRCRPSPASGWTAGAYRTRRARSGHASGGAPQGAAVPDRLHTARTSRVHSASASAADRRRSRPTLRCWTTSRTSMTLATRP